MGLALLRKYGDEIEISFPLLPTLYPPAYWLATHLGQHWYGEEDQREKGLDSGLVRCARPENTVLNCGTDPRDSSGQAGNEESGRGWRHFSVGGGQGARRSSQKKKPPRLERGQRKQARELWAQDETSVLWNWKKMMLR